MHSTSTFYPRLIKAGGWYDLLLTLPFATPWTAKWFIGIMNELHEYLSLSGAAIQITDSAYLFLALFGSIVSIWSVLRIVKPLPILGLTDGVARIAFSIWFTLFPLLFKTSTISLFFLVPELGFAVLQLGGYKKTADPVQTNTQHMVSR